jgi:hypothetical protein
MAIFFLEGISFHRKILSYIISKLNLLNFLILFDAFVFTALERLVLFYRKPMARTNELLLLLLIKPSYHLRPDGEIKP